MPPELGINPENYYELIFRKDGPFNLEEERMLKKFDGNYVKYMNWKRSQVNVEWWVTMIQTSLDIITQNISPSNWEKLYRKNLKLYDLSPKLNMMNLRPYLGSQPNQKGTSFPVIPVYLQRIPGGKLVHMSFSKTGKVKKLQAQMNG